jgi:hypothetical protein
LCGLPETFRGRSQAILGPYAPNDRIHIAEGEVMLDGQTLKAGDAAVLSGESAARVLGAKHSQVLLFDLN